MLNMYMLMQIMDVVLNFPENSTVSIVDIQRRIPSGFFKQKIVKTLKNPLA